MSTYTRCTKISEQSYWAHSGETHDGSVGDHAPDTNVQYPDWWGYNRRWIFRTDASGATHFSLTGMSLAEDRSYPPLYQIFQGSYPNSFTDNNGKKTLNGWKSINNNGTIDIDMQFEPNTVYTLWIITKSGAGNQWYNNERMNLYSTGSEVITLSGMLKTDLASASNVTLGNAPTIKWTPTSTALHYKLKFDLGGVSYTTGIISPNKTTEYTYNAYTMAVDKWAPAITNATTGNCTVTLYTYTDSNGSNTSGNTSKTFTVTVPSSVVPTLNTPTATINNSNSTFKSWGIAVAGYSTITLKATASGAYGSTISSFTVSGAASNTKAGASYEWTTGVLNGSGEKTFTVKATDSRGRTAEKSVKVTFYAYDQPRITAFSAMRLSSSSTKIKENARWAITTSVGGNTNTATATIRYKKAADSSWVTYGNVNSGDTTLTTTFDDMYSYNLQLTVSDTAGYSATSDITVSTMDILLDFRQGGKGLGVGKVAEADEMQIAMPARFYEDVVFDKNIKVSRDDIGLINIGLLAYPVGAYYMSSDATSPASLFGGTWEQIQDRFLYAAGSKAVDTTGGEEAHALTTAEGPAHEHTRGTMNITGSILTSWGDNSGGGLILQENAGNGALYPTHNGTARFRSADVSGTSWSNQISFDASRSWTGKTSSSGSGSAHNNMPPYLVAYCWHRIK